MVSVIEFRNVTTHYRHIVPTANANEYILKDIVFEQFYTIAPAYYVLNVNFCLENSITIHYCRLVWQKTCQYYALGIIHIYTTAHQRDAWTSTCGINIKFCALPHVAFQSE